MTKKIKRSILLFVVFLFTICLGGCTFFDNLFSGTKDPSTFDETTKEMFYLILGNDELSINYLINNREEFGLEYYEPSLPTPSLTGIVDLAAINLLLGQVKEYDYEQLNADQKMTYNLIVNLVDGINAQTTEMGYLDNNYLGSYLGYQAQLPLILAEYNFNSVKDVENYLKFLALIPETFKTYYEFEVLKADNNYGPNDTVINNVVSQCTNFIAAIDDGSSFMFKVVNDKINNCDFLNVEQKQFFVEQNNTYVKTFMRDGYKYIEENLPSLKGRGTNDMGLMHYKGSNNDNLGARYYELLFQEATGYDITCDEAITYVERKIASYMGELERLAGRITSNALLYNEYSQLTTSEKFMSNSDPLDQLYYYYETVQSDFPALPYKPEITVKYIDESMQDNFSPAAYMVSPMDAVTKETIYLNPASIYVTNPAGQSVLDTQYLFTTLAHEGLPGHLYQNVYFKSQDVNPIRKLLKNSGYTEGWATYAENYAYQFLSEKYSSTIIEYLQTEQKLIAAIYSRIDLGIHYDGWTCEEMHAFMSKYFNVGTVENVRDSYNQLVEIPTNYQEYFFTYLKICDMYDRVKNKKGDNFNAKEFHKYILDCGPAPLRFVEEVVYDAYRIK